jgi:hypothetical protein
MLNEPEEDGSPLLDHLLAVERATGVRPQLLLDAPPLPEGCESVWAVFNELHSARGSNGMGPNQIGFVEIDAYQRVTGIRLAGWEIAAVRLADLAFLKHWKPVSAASQGA